MEWPSQYRVWVLIFGGFIALHIFGHGGHGDGGRDDDEPAGKDGKQRAPKQGPDHQH